VHLGVHGVERSHVKQTAPQTGLVGGHHHMPTGVVQPRNGLQRTGQRLPLGRGLDELCTVFVDGAVAVEDDKLISGGQAGQIGHAVHGVVQGPGGSGAGQLFGIDHDPSKKASTGARSAARVCSEAV
jgi:hypothetical protein